MVSELRCWGRTIVAVDGWNHLAATATPAATAAAPSTSSLSFPVPAVDGEDDNEDVDEFNGFDTLSEYDAGVTEIDEEDEKALTAFMSKETSSKRSLGDIILQKIKEKDATVSTYRAFSMVNMNYARIRGGDRRRLAQPGGVVLFNHSEADFAMKPGDYIVQMTIQMIVNCDTGGRRGGGPRRHRPAGGRVRVHRWLNSESW
ncbi:hypothetical protein TRIUR3_20007 [Triticum urartu]|uniref:Uncharacterized protein n=1 Tax=Triticum urartu TaxID=4572 RepID=M7ZJ21_TRIUA|nr:hypothetical protein TRIUR3_20007 [Triticum urartu]